MLHPESGGTPPKTLGQIRHSRGIIGAWHDSYLIKVDGLGRVTQRNRRFLRKFVPASPIIGAPHRPIWNIPAQELDTAPVVTIPSNTTVAPTTAVNIRDDHTAELRNEPEQVQEELVIDTTPSASPTPAAVVSRPEWATKAPLIYEPESGKWVSQ